MSIVAPCLFGPYRDAPNKVCENSNSRLYSPTPTSPERPSLFHPRQHNPLQVCYSSSKHFLQVPALDRLQHLCIPGAPSHLQLVVTDIVEPLDDRRWTLIFASESLLSTLASLAVDINRLGRSGQSGGVPTAHAQLHICDVASSCVRSRKVSFKYRNFPVTGMEGSDPDLQCPFLYSFA